MFAHRHRAATRRPSVCTYRSSDLPFCAWDGSRKPQRASRVCVAPLSCISTRSACCARIDRRCRCLLRTIVLFGFLFFALFLVSLSSPVLHAANDGPIVTVERMPCRELADRSQCVWRETNTEFHSDYRAHEYSENRNDSKTGFWLLCLRFVHSSRAQMR